MSRGWIGCDLDGCLAHYDGWHGETYIGAPVPAMVERVKQWLKEGKTVKIFTARVGNIEKYAIRDNVTQAIQRWCMEHIGQVLEVTATKDYGMIELYDDRCVQIETNTGRRIDGKP